MAGASKGFEGDQINLSGTFIGSVYVKTTITGAVNSVTNIGGVPTQQDEVKSALKRLEELLETVGDDKAQVTKKVADSAKDVIEAAGPGADRSFFEGCADTLRNWAEKISATVPAITEAAQAVISSVAVAKGWL